MYTKLNDWRPSLLPPWNGSLDLTWDHWERWPAPEHNRLLPLPPHENHTDQIQHTPIARLEGGSAGLDWVEKKKGWLEIAQFHYSLMRNLDERLRTFQHQLFRDDW